MPLLVSARSARPDFADNIATSDGQIAAQERFAAGEPHAVHAEADEDVGEPADFLEVEQIVLRQPHVVGLRHAVLAAQIAAVRDRQAEVPQRSVQKVEHGPGTNP